jgi:hypothetical protein
LHEGVDISVEIGSGMLLKDCWSKGSEKLPLFDVIDSVLDVCTSGVCK